MKKILIVARPSGGIRTYCKYLYTSMDCSRYDITILAPDYEASRLLTESLKVPRLNAVYTTSVSPYHKLNFSSIAREIIQGNYDVVHSHGFTAGLFGALPASCTKTPHLMTGHNLFEASDYSGVNGRLKRRVMSFVFNKYL